MSFSGTIYSDYLKLSKVPLRKKPSYIDFAPNDFVGLRDSIISYVKAVYPEEFQLFVEADLGMFRS